MVIPAFASPYVTPSGETGLTPDTNNVQDELHKFHKNMDVWFMVMLVAFLMLFIKKFEWGVCLATMLTLAGSFISHSAIRQFVLGQPWNQDFMIMGVFCGITVVIGIGVFLGTIKTWQYLLAGLLFAPAWLAVEWFMFTYLKGVVDPGGSMLVHMVAAYWGWGVLIGLQEKRSFEEPFNTTTHSISFVWLGSMLLFVLWPSFVTALLPGDLVTWGMMTTYMAGLGSVISAYLTCVAFEKKVDPLVYTYALLAGMVSIGAPLISVGPWAALGIGLIAGVISVVCFVKLHPWLCEKIGVFDVMGVHNLHGVPGVWGAIAGAIFAAGYINIVSLVGVILISLVTGGITGIILKATRGEMGQEELFSDESMFLGWNPEPTKVMVTERKDGSVPSTQSAE
ncbi:MAG: ammonium transporter [Methanosarcinaceae archaeon]|nr:ammonium transporter [Methanosarcinaceae archaeon]MDD4332089.1 ammonium transporter [Methanosarcinaceae archaeon]MDD4748803.1 ammonium transporter [Methanosarcinaceae archaeon]